MRNPYLSQNTFLLHPSLFFGVWSAIGGFHPLKIHPSVFFMMVFGPCDFVDFGIGLIILLFFFIGLTPSRDFKKILSLSLFDIFIF